MKIKYLILLAMSLSFCALGCACSKEQPKGAESSSSPTESSEQEEITVKEDPVLSVNQSAVTIGVGETFTLTADAENVEEPVFLWTVDGDAAQGIVTLSQSGNTATIKGVAVGETKLVASVEYDGHVYFKSVSVTVKESSDVTLVLSNNVGFDKDGYHVRLSTISTDAGDETSIVPIVTAYKNNAIVATEIEWQSADLTVAMTDGNKFVSVGEGKTSIIGSCEIDGTTYSVSVSVEVYRPTIALDEKFVIETENLSDFTIESEVRGNAKDVTYNGESVGSFDTQSKLVTLTKSKLPRAAAEMGENRQLVLETSLANYTVNIDLYTKIIRTKADFDGVAALAKIACPNSAALWDGYFVLGADIEYNAPFISKIADLDSLWVAVEGSWYNGGLYGFKGVFDGKGHKIEGISIDGGKNIASVFGVLHIDGVIKNISFTKASVTANSSFVCSAGGGTVENVYVQYDSMGQGVQHYEGDGSVNNYCGTFFSFKEPTATANVSNCVIDVTKATCNMDAEITVVGSEYVSIKNVFVIGGSEELRKASNATLSFASVLEFMQDSNAQNRYKNFNTDFWSLERGVPVSNTVYNEVYDKEVNFIKKLDYLVAGTSYQFSVDNDYFILSSDNPNVVINGNVATVLDSAANGEQAVITATSIFDETKVDTFSCTLSKVDFTNITDLTAEAEYAFYDMTVDTVYLAELGAKIPEEILYYVNEDYSTATYAEATGRKAVLAITKDKVYKINCMSVTKVIAEAEDLHYVRRDYTVYSYGNAGCYDGLLIGTFVLVNDIDCTGLSLPDTGKYWENSRGFRGTFDGRGYTISNLEVGANGLFGNLTHAIIKNVNFTDVRLVANQGSGAYVSLFATRVFDTTIKDVSMQFSSYVVGGGLMFFETTFDSTFTGLTINISGVSDVDCLTEWVYDENPPYLSVAKSTYSDITVIVADLNKIPAFAYGEDVIPYPDGFTFQDTEGNVKE